MVPLGNPTSCFFRIAPMQSESTTRSKGFLAAESRRCSSISASTVMFSLFSPTRLSRTTDIPISSSKSIGIQDKLLSNHCKRLRACYSLQSGVLLLQSFLGFPSDFANGMGIYTVGGHRSEEHTPE